MNADNIDAGTENVAKINDNDFDNTPVRETRTLVDIYQRYNIAIVEPANYNEVVESSY